MNSMLRLATWTYHCDEQDVDYDVLLRYDVHPAERSRGIPRGIELLGVHEVLSGYLNLEGLPVKLEPGDWEQRMKARIETRLARSDALREHAETACWRTVDEFCERFLA